MNTHDQKLKQLRRKLIRQLNECGSSFELSAFIQSTGIDQQLANSLAESVYAHW